MTRDWHTNTPEQAAKAARADTYPVDDRDRDEPGISEADHNCRDIPHPDDCWGCAAFVRAAELADREADPVWREHVAEQNAEYWKEGA